MAPQVLAGARLVRGLERLWARLTHASRRKAALACLRSAWGRPASILVVCQGNRCRSPYAAAALKRALAARNIPARVDSAGFSTPNKPPPADALNAAAARGLELSAHRSKSVTRHLLDAATLVLVMDQQLGRAVVARQARAVVVLGDLDPDPMAVRGIRDPFGRGQVAFDECYDRIDRCIASFVDAFVSGRWETPEPATDPRAAGA